MGKFLGVGVALPVRLEPDAPGMGRAIESKKDRRPFAGSEAVAGMQEVLDEVGAKPEAAPMEAPKLKVLVVDDEKTIRDLLVRFLNRKGYRAQDAANARDALDIYLADPEVRMILSDLRMPGGTGLDLLAEIKKVSERDCQFVILTGHGDREDAIGALRLGAQDFLQKPIDLDHLIHVIERGREMIDLRDTQRRFQENLEREVAFKTTEVRSLLTRLEFAYEEAINHLAVAAEYKDPETGQHTRRIGAYAKMMAGVMGWSDQRQKEMELAAPLHDIGKIGTPDHLLLKAGKLTHEEVEVIKQHSRMGFEILDGSDYPVVRCAARIALAHHEYWDGTGYPNGLKGEDIPIEARITTVCDIYDALRSARPYKPPLDHRTVMKIMLEGDGRTLPHHFDPALKRLFEDNADGFADIFARYA